MTDEKRVPETNEAGNTILFLAVVVAFALLAFGAYTLLKKDTDKIAEIPVKEEVPVVQTETRTIVIENPVANATTTIPILIKGSVYGNGWVAYEGQAGTVSILDEAGKVVVEATPLKVSGEWMKLPANFEVTVGDEKLAKSLAGKIATLRFVAENPSGKGETKTVDLKILIAK